MKVLKLFLLFFILILGCSSPKNKLLSETDSTISIIDIENALKNISNTPFKCSEFIDSIEYLKLETNKESIFGGGKFAVPLLPSSEFIYCDLKKFNLKDGKYIYQVGKRGRGPGEFTMAISSTTDIEDNRVFVLDNWTHQIYIYDNNNNFIKKLDVLPEIQEIMFMGDNRLILFRTNVFYGLTVPFEYQIYDINVDKVVFTREIKSLKEAQNRKAESTYIYFGLGRNNHWYFNNKVQFFESISDTIFTLEPDGKRIPRFYVYRENMRPTLSDLLDNKLFETNRLKYIDIVSTFETTQYLFFRVRRGVKETFCARYDKVNNETIVVPLIGAFENDLSFSNFTSFTNTPGQSSGIDYFDISLQKEKLLSKMSKIPRSEWPDPAKRLCDLIVNANPEDNGIICTYIFKN